MVKKFFLSLFAALTVSLLLIVAILSWGEPVLIKAASQYIKKNFGLTLTAAHLDIKLFSGRLQVKNVSLKDAKRAELIISELEFDLSVRELLGGNLVVTEAIVKDSKLSFPSELFAHFSGDLEESEQSPQKLDFGIPLDVRKGQVIGLELIEEFGDGEKVHLKGGNIYLSGDGSKIMLKETIENVSFSNNSKLWDLGRLEAEQSVAEDMLHINALRFSGGSVEVSSENLSILPNLSGNLKASLLTSEFVSTEKLDIPLHLSLTAGGTLADTILNYSLTSQGDFRIGGTGFSSLNVGGKILKSDQNVRLEIQDFDIEGSSGYMRISETIIIDEAALSGKLELDLPELNFGNAGVKRIRGGLEIGGNLYKPLLSADVTASEIRADPLQFGEVKLSVSNDGFDTLSVNLKEAENLHGKTDLEVRINFSGEPAIESAKFDFKRNLSEPKLSFSASGSAQGSINLESLTADVEIKALLDRGIIIPFSANATLSGSVISVLLEQDPSTKLRAAIYLKDGQPSSVDFNIDQKDLAQWVPRVECGKLAAEGKYTFFIDSWFSGRGHLKVKEASFGCGLEQIAVESVLIPIEEGLLMLANVQLKTGITLGVLSGTISAEAIDATVKGQINFASLQPFVHAAEELAGIATVSISATGSVTEPTLEGEIKVQDVSFGMLNPSVEVSNVQADIFIKDNQVVLKRFNATANDGSINGSGSALLFDPLNTLEAELDFRSLFFQPVSDLQVTMTGKLVALGRAEVDGRTLPLIKGTVVIDDARYEKEFGLDLVREKITSLFRSTRVSLVAADKPDTPIGLDITISGDSTGFVNTNLVKAELSPRLRLKGNTGELLLNGVIIIPNGRFDLGGKHFEITSGVIRFTGEGFEPDISVSAETRTVDTEGLPLTIFIEISGPASDIRILLSSDTGLAQEKLMSLLTAGQGFGTQGLINSTLRHAGLGALDLGGPNSILGVLSRIDEIAIEPSYNVASGELGSKIVSSEKLTDKVIVGAQFPFAGRTEQPQAFLSYEVLKHLAAIGSFKMPQDELEQSYAGDLEWEIISGESPSPVSFSGNTEIQDAELTQVTGIVARSTLNPARVPAIEKRLYSHYRNLGFLDVVVSSEYHHDRQAISFQIIEGPEYTLEEVDVAPDLRPFYNQSDFSFWSLRPQAADEAFRTRVESDLVAALRQAGYPRARVKSYFQRTDSKSAILKIEGSLRQRYEIKFTRNNNFSESELLRSFRYYERSIALTTSFPYDLRLELEKFYRERGFARVGIAMQIARSGGNDSDKEELVSIWYDIFEGPKVKVGSVLLENSPINEEELKKFLPSSEAKTIFEPSFYNPEASGAAKTILQNLLHDNGYPDALVSMKEEPLSYHSVNLRYQIDAGEAQRYQTEIVGRPKGLDLEVPATSLSFVKAKDLMKEVERSVRQAGYFDAKLNLEKNEEARTAKIIIDSGNQQRFGELSISGQEQVKIEVIVRALPFKEGDPFAWSKVGDTRRALYKLGLFNKVEVRIIDSPTLGPLYRAVEVVVQEKPLTSLDVTTGFDSTYGAHFGISGNDRSFFKDGREFSLRSDLYYDLEESEIGRGFGLGRFRDPTLSENSSWTEEIGFLNTLESRIQEYNLETVFLRSEIQYAISPSLTLKTDHLLEGLHISDAPPDVILSSLDQGSSTLSSIGGGIVYTNMDTPLNPGVAKKAEFVFRIYSSIVGSDSDHLTLLPKLSFLEPLDFFVSRFSFFGGLQGGYVSKFAETTEIPISKRYYLGGQDTIRGYSQNSLGPRGSLGSVIGGDRFFAGTGELRYEVIQDVTILGFLDAGQLWLESEGQDQLRLGAGAGLRYGSPIGSIGFDIGIPLDPDEYTSPYEFYFRIGATF